jgi:hypothetical protein
MVMHPHVCTCATIVLIINGSHHRLGAPILLIIPTVVSNGGWVWARFRLFFFFFDVYYYINEYILSNVTLGWFTHIEFLI